jgi:hypothetical protein
MNYTTIASLSDSIIIDEQLADSLTNSILIKQLSLLATKNEFVSLRNQMRKLELEYLPVIYPLKMEECNEAIMAMLLSLE